MGRIGTKLIKRNAKLILNSNPNKFSKEFESNKKSLLETADIRSKKLRNTIAGYVTRLVKKQKA